MILKASILGAGLGSVEVPELSPRQSDEAQLAMQGGRGSCP